MNIYITTENEKKLRELEAVSMSGLINCLLDNFFNRYDPKEVQRVLKPKLKKLKEDYPIAADALVRMAANDIV